MYRVRSASQLPTRTRYIGPYIDRSTMSWNNKEMLVKLIEAPATCNATELPEKKTHNLHRWTIGWLAVTITLVILTDYRVFHARPYLLRDWRGVVIFILSLLILVIYETSLTRRSEQWPPPLFSSLAIFVSIYGAVVLLTLIDGNFVWDFYIVLGTVLGRFAGRRLLLLTAILFLSLCIFGGVITWPFDWTQINSILGIGISFFGTAASAVVIQNMITERYKRNRLLDELTQAHNELSDAHQRLANTAVQEQELAVLRERNRLAREMHDTLGHALVLVTVKLEVAQRLHERDPERSNSELAATQQIVRQSMNELRASIANLRSPTLEHEPVSRALSRFAHEMSRRTGVRVTNDLQPDIEALPEQVEETLWKVGQEAIANIEKHAYANNVFLHMSKSDGMVHMRIEDDGVGLPHDCIQHKANGQTAYTSPSGHYGLSGMTERIERIGGTLSLRPGAERGTVVEVVLPLAEVPLQSVRT